MSTQSKDTDLFLEAWSTFNEQITSDEDAADAIFQSLLQDNKIDCGCDYPQILHLSGARCFRCLSCQKEVRFTAGTLFAGASRLRAWMAAIWFREWGVAVSSLRLSRLLDIAQSTALNINKKVSIALVECMDDEAQRVNAKHFSDVIFKRSRHTPADEHPRSEMRDELEIAFESQPPLDEVPHSRIDLTSFPLAQSAHRLAMSVVIAAAIAFIREFFHGISHKYLQVYLAAFWCHFDREAWSHGSVLRACLKHPPIRYSDLLHYQAPDIRIMPLDLSRLVMS